MKTVKDLIQAIKEDKPLVWNDPDPIDGNDYNITYIGEVNEYFDEDTPILIQYGGGSEAQVLLHEISIKQ